MNNCILKKFLSKKTLFLLLIIAAIVGGVMLYMNGKKSEIKYRTSTVSRSDLRSVIQATGTLDAVETVDVGTQISGTVKEIYIDYNSVVKKGDLIAEIDSATQQADVAQAQANLMAAQADLLNYQAVLTNAKKNLQRTEELSRRDLVAKSDVDSDVKTCATAGAQVAAARAKIAQYSAALTKSKINLGYTKIYSPVDGVVVAKNVDKGQTVAASYQTPSIAEIARDLKDMQVEVNVDEADIGGVKQGQPAEFTVDTHPTEIFKGKVTQIRLSPTTTNNVVTYTVIVKVQNEKGLLLPGMTANVSLVMQEREDVLTVPNSAFRFKPVDLSAVSVEQGPPGRGKSKVAEVRKPAVYTIQKKKPVRVEVEKGITDGSATEILSGLKEGDKVITGIVVEKEGK